MIELKIIDHEFYKHHDIPSYATTGSAAIDLVCTQDYIIKPGAVSVIKTGLAIHIGSGVGKCNMAALIMPRSGLGTKGLVLSNSIGLIDEDYQGELIVTALNRNMDKTINLYSGDRFAQMMFVPILKPSFSIVGEFTTTSDRGKGGFGSTGK